MKFRITPAVLAEAFLVDSKQAYRLLSIVLMGILVCLSLLLINMGSPPISAMPGDVAIILEGGWRVYSGQIPHVDYYSPLGPLTSLLTAFGMTIAAPSAASITYGNVLLFAVIVPWSWLIASSRLSALNAFTFSLFMGILTIAPRALGDNFLATSYAMLYNRHGFVFISLLFLTLFIPSRFPEKKEGKAFDGFSSGCLLSLLFLCKVSYFAVALVAIFLACIIFPSLIWLGGLAGGVLCILIPMQLFFDVSLPAIFADVRFASQVQSSATRLRGLMIDVYYSIFHIFLLFVLVVSISNNFVNGKGKLDRATFRKSLFIAFPLIVTAGLLICATNAQDGDIPLFYVAGLIMLEYYRREIVLADKLRDGIVKLNYFWCSLLVIPILCGSILFQDVGSLAYSLVWNKFMLPSVPAAQRLNSENMYDFLVASGPVGYEIDSRYAPQNSRVIGNFVKPFNDGLSLLRRNIKAEEKIFLLGFYNPFSFALGIPSPKGDALWWHEYRTFSQSVFPDVNQVFGDVDLVIVRTGSDSSPTTLMQDIYGAYLEEHFYEKDSSSYWTLLARTEL